MLLFIMRFGMTSGLDTVAAKIIRPPNKKIFFVLFFQDERSHRSEGFIMP